MLCSHVDVNGLQLFTFQKESFIQYVPFLFYTRILYPILVQTLFLLVTNQIKTTQTVWQVPQWALGMTSFDFTCDLYHRKPWCFNTQLHLKLLYLMDDVLKVASDWPLHHFEKLLACYLHPSLAKAQYFKSPSIKLTWKILRRWEEEKKALTWIKLEVALQF